MKLKQRVGDFRVRELLHPDYLKETGEFRVYRVTKRKLTTPEAVRAVADLAGVEPGEVSIAGLKDRQGITIQHVSVERGRDLRIQEKELKVETAGFADLPLSSEHSRGNAFELGVRGLSKADVQRLRSNLPGMREHGVANYFDDQRFGNLEFGQGWILVDLMRGDVEKALRMLLTGSSERDDDHHRRFKAALDAAWGDWRRCRDVAGKYGAHHSIFEHLGREPEDFLGAFEHVSTRVKTIHLFAYQSHLWNRAVAELVRAETPVEARVAMPCIEGPLVSWADAVPAGLRDRETFPLPGPGLDDVDDPRAYALLEDTLAKERLVPDRLRVEGVSGFHLKGEPRALHVVPQHLRVRPAEADALNPGAQLVRVRFELPRGAYATLVVKRLLAHRVGDEPVVEAPRPARSGGPGPRGGDRGGRGFADQRERGPQRRGRDERGGRGERREREPDAWGGRRTGGGRPAAGGPGGGARRGGSGGAWKGGARPGGRPRRGDDEGGSPWGRGRRGGRDDARGDDARERDPWGRARRKKDDREGDGPPARDPRD